jgi:hypothetical protein
LESQGFAVGTPIGFSIVATEGQLTNIFEVFFREGGCCLRCAALILSKNKAIDAENKEKNKGDGSHGIYFYFPQD